MIYGMETTAEDAMVKLLFSLKVMKTVSDVTVHGRKPWESDRS